MANHYDLDRHIAIVTGAAGGIGSCIALRLAASGARIALLDIDEQGLDVVKGDFQDALALCCDITDEDSVRKAVAKVERELGSPTILVNAAGILGPVAAVHDYDVAACRKVMEVNFMGAFICSAETSRAMRRAGHVGLRRSIVNIGSIQGKEGMPLGSAYSASKAAMMALTRAQARELTGDNIHVTCITPAAVETAMAALMTEERRADILGRIPMGRFCEAEEVASMVAFLVSPDCSFSTGGIFDLSGGRADS